VVGTTATAHGIYDDNTNIQYNIVIQITIYYKELVKSLQYLHNIIYVIYYFRHIYTILYRSIISHRIFVR